MILSDRDPRAFGRRIFVAATILAALHVGLLLALAALALRSRPVLVVPGVRDAQVVTPDEVPEAAVRTFGLHYLRYFDDYTPTTLEERSNFALRFVAPERIESLVQALSERASYVARAKESSHLFLPLPGACEVTRQTAGTFRLSALADRRIFIAGELKNVSPVRYTLEIRPGLPTDDNPYGLLVVGQSIRSESPKEESHGDR